MDYACGNEKNRCFGTLKVKTNLLYFWNLMFYRKTKIEELAETDPEFGALYYAVNEDWTGSSKRKRRRRRRRRSTSNSVILPLLYV